MADTSIGCFHEMDCEEKNTEPKEADEKEKKTDILEYLSFNNLHDLVIHNQLSFAHHSSLLYLNSDYSLGVYSPPEQVIA